nr:asparagine synthase-related protein [uncultured Draconibacterium sp.]
MPDVKIEISKNTEQHDFFLADELKFDADNFVIENHLYEILIKGVSFNFTTLDATTNFRLFVNEYQQKGIEYLNSLRGSLCGSIYDKIKKEYIVFTNHIGDQKLYYAETANSIYIGSDLFELASSLRKESVKLNLNLNAAYSLLSFGYLIDNATLVSEIKRIPAGHYLYIDQNGNSQLLKYFELNNQPDSVSNDDDLVDELDNLFKKAVKREFEKDILYGFKHFSSISGGLDCRMTNWVAKKLGYNNVTTYTFSQYGYLDMSIAHEIAAYLGYEWIFKSLDPGDYLTNIDEMVRLTNAQITYSGSAHAQSMIKLLNLTDFGIIHSGQLGDVTIGTYSPLHAYRPASASNVKAMSRRFVDKVEVNWADYKNQELATYEIRGFNGILTGNFIFQPYTEVASPFLDIDFLNFCFSIPAEKRAYHQIYKKWILKKYPQAAQFKWESIDAKIDEKILHIRGKAVPFSKLARFIYNGIFYRLGKPVDGTHSAFNMNPFDYWYKTNNNLSKIFNNHFNDNIHLVQDNELQRDCELLFQQGAVIEKMQVLTLLSAIKQLSF